MKNIIITLMATVASALLLAGCVTDAEQAGGTYPEGTRTITFTLPTVSAGAQTYVDTEDGEDTIADLAIYMFDKTTTKLERVFRTPEISIEPPVDASAKPTVTIDVTERFGGKTFFFVGNGDAVTSQLKAARFNVTTATDFEKMLCDVHDALPGKPLLMSFKKEVDDVEKVAAVDLEVVFKRRVARFDVDNDASVTNFTIENIIISGFNMQGNVFGTAPADPLQTMEKSELITIPFEALTNTNTNTATAVPSVFYAFPTTVGTGKAEISIEGKLRGKTRIYTYELASDLEIEANKRYTLKAVPVPVNEIQMEFSVVEWEDHGTDVDVETEPNAMILTPLKKVTGGGTFVDATTYDVFNTTEPGTLTFNTNTFRAEGTRVEVEYLVGDDTQLPITVNSTAPVLTYGASYEQTHEIEITYPGKKHHVEALLRVINNYDPSKREFIHVTSMPIYPGTNHKAVQVGGVWWAPLNVGAKNVGGATSSEDDHGRLFQWGRNNDGFLFTNTNPTVQGALSLTASLNSTNKNKFIMHPAGSPSGDWLDNPDNTLWDENNAQGPCPAGWRLPLESDCMKIVDAYSQEKVTYQGQNLACITGDDEEVLYMGIHGFIVGGDGKIQTPQAYSLYWSVGAWKTTQNDTWRGQGLILNFSGKIQFSSGAYKAHAFSVRCVAVE